MFLSRAAVALAAKKYRGSLPVTMNPLFQKPFIFLNGPYYSVPFSSSSLDENSSSSNDIQDCFETLGIQRNFSISNENTKTAYKALMSKLHPDRHSSAAEEDRASIHALASEVTKAYGVVSDPYLRASHLLELLDGKTIDETDTGDLVGNSFLFGIMEIREEIDDTSDQTELKRLKTENATRIQDTCRDLAAAFDNDDFQTAKQLTAQLQYWNRVGETIHEKITVVD